MWLSGRVSARHAQTLGVRHPVMHGRAVEVTAYRGRTEQVKGGGGGAQAHPQAMVSAGPARATVSFSWWKFSQSSVKEATVSILDKLKGGNVFKYGCRDGSVLKSTGYSCEGQELGP